MATLSINQVAHNFGNKSVLKEVTFQANHGEIIGLFGRNGSGKSTLLKLIFKELKLQRGTIQINQKSIRQITYADRLIGYLPQHRILPSALKVRTVIAMCSANGAAQDKIFYAPGIAEISNKFIFELSQGNLKYLTALLIVNMPNPILLLDEPFSMIDPLIKEHFANLLEDKKKDKLIILTDHYYQDVLNICDWGIILRDGIAQQISTADELKAFNYIN